ncbi:MAG: hypothetical protein ACJ8EL_23020 [Rhizomicrobium sp.]
MALILAELPVRLAGLLLVFSRIGIAINDLLPPAINLLPPHIDVVLELAAAQLGNGVAEPGAGFQEIDGIAVDAAAAMAELVGRRIDRPGQNHQARDFADDFRDAVFQQGFRPRRCLRVLPAGV